MDKNELIYQTLLDVKENIGELTASVRALNGQMNSHVSDDKAVAARVTTLEASHHRMRGAAAVWSLVISAVISLIGVIIGKH